MSSAPSTYGGRPTLKIFKLALTKPLYSLAHSWSVKWNGFRTAILHKLDGVYRINVQVAGDKVSRKHLSVPIFQ